MPITKSKVAAPKKKAVKKEVLPTGFLGRFTTTDGQEQYKVQRTETEFIFGCGDQTFTHEEVRNFLTELAKEQKKKKTQQRLDYEKVASVIEEENFSIEDLDPQQLKAFFFNKQAEQEDDDDC